MKKFLALLLAAMMLFGTVSAFAEGEDAEVVGDVEAVTDYVGTELEADELLDFNIAMDAIPEGYTMETFALDGDLYAIFSNEEDENAISYVASIAFSEMFDGYTFSKDAMSEEELANMVAMLIEDSDLTNPAYSFVQTSHGTDAIMIDDNDGATDTVELITIYQGYFISIVLVKNGTLTEDDCAAGLKLLSDMWIVPAN